MGHQSTLYFDTKSDYKPLTMNIHIHTHTYTYYRPFFTCSLSLFLFLFTEKIQCSGPTIDGTMVLDFIRFVEHSVHSGPCFNTRGRIVIVVREYLTQ